MALLAGVTAAFAQGKVALVGDTLSHVVLSSNPALVASADQSLVGQAVGNVTPLPSGVVLVAGLWGGSTQGSMILQTSTLLNNAAVEAGWISQTRVALVGVPGIASGTAIGAATPWFQVRVWDSALGVNEAGWLSASGGAGYSGSGALFQMNPGNSIAYVLTAPPGINTTWTEGNIVLSVPEPSTFALAGLGAAALLIFRRRK